MERNNAWLRELIGRLSMARVSSVSHPPLVLKHVRRCSFQPPPRGRTIANHAHTVALPSATRIAACRSMACLRVACGAFPAIRAYAISRPASSTSDHFTTRRSGPVSSRLVAATTSCRPNSVTSMLIDVSGGRRGPGSRYSAKTRRASSMASRTNFRSDTPPTAL
jgi:hypothetical protein